MKKIQEIKLEIVIVAVICLALVAAGCCQKQAEPVKTSSQVTQSVTAEPVPDKPSVPPTVVETPAESEPEPPAPAAPVIPDTPFQAAVKQGNLDEAMKLGWAVLDDTEATDADKVAILMDMKGVIYDLGTPERSLEFEKEGYEIIKALPLSYGEKADSLGDYVLDSVERNIALNREEAAHALLVKAREECSRIFLDPEIRNKFVMQLYRYEKKVELLLKNK